MAEVYEIELDRDGLQRSLGEGVPKGLIGLVMGEYGAGKSAIMQRLTYGFLRNGVTVTYVSTELTTKGFIDQMKSLDYPIVSNLLSGDLLFIPVYPLIGKAIPREDFLNKLMEAKQLYDREVLIIDTFSSLTKKDLKGQRSLQVLAFFKKLTALNKTIILTMDTEEIPEHILSPFQSDSEIYIGIKKAVFEGATTRTMQVHRFGKTTEPITDAIGFRIEPKIGFIIDITTVA
ncbi:MAG: ATPase [Thermoplasmata archaeon]|nr:ATPase [Thermoplasmata archaeon]